MKGLGIREASEQRDGGRRSRRRSEQGQKKGGSRNAGGQRQ